MKIKRAYGALTDGTTWDGVPVTPATSVQLEKTMRASNWDADHNPMTMEIFMSWHAAKLAGVNVGPWEDFPTTAEHASIEVDDLDPTTARQAMRLSGPRAPGITSPSPLADSPASPPTTG